MTTPAHRAVDRQQPASALTPSLVRTLVPFVAGLIGTWLVDRFALEVDTATIGGLLVAGIGYIYYVVARFLEVYGSTKWGYILGFRKLPVYADPPQTVVVPEQGQHPGEGFGEVGGTVLTTVGLVLVVLATLLVLIQLLTAQDGLPVGVGLLIAALGVVLIVVDRAPRMRP